MRKLLKNKNLSFSLLLLAVFISLFFLLKGYSLKQIESIGNIVIFECKSGNSINGIFYENGNAQVSVHSDDGLVYTDKLSKSDSKYYSSDKSVIFWSEGDEELSTFLQKDGIIIESCKFLTFAGD